MKNDFHEILKFLDSNIMSERMPVLFVGHGSPMNAINGSKYAKTWQEIGRHLPQPKAIVCMSAHWLTNGTFVSAISKPNLVYDFYGFPTELYKVVCPATGDEKIAEEICALEKTIQRDTERGLDHGVWTVLMHLFPQANIPVLQISIDYENSRRSQYELMKNLRPLRNQGVLFMGSGNIIHNLGLLRAGQPYDWAIEFDALSKKHISEHNIDALFNREAQGSIAELAIPTDDHYRPMLNTLALMDDTESILFFNEEIDLGSIGMRSFITRAT